MSALESLTKLRVQLSDIRLSRASTIQFRQLVSETVGVSALDLSLRESPTRYKSTTTMIENAIQLRPAIDIWSDNRGLPSLDTADWTVLAIHCSTLPLNTLDALGVNNARLPEQSIVAKTLPHLIIISSRLQDALNKFTRSYNRHAAFWHYADRISVHLATQIMCSGQLELPPSYFITIRAFTEAIHQTNAIGPMQWQITGADVNLLELAEKVCIDLDIRHVDDTPPDDDELPPLIPHFSSTLSSE